MTDTGCECPKCVYERTMDAIRYYGYYDSSPDYRVSDPFGPPPSPKVYFCRSCMKYHPEGYNHAKTGRFKYTPPRMQQEPRRPRIEIQGEYRRFYDQSKDMIHWQYKPWKNAEWRTYYSVSSEAIHIETKSYGEKIVSKKFNTAAAHALSEERFYKVERIDQTA